jgi:hypothetical protein
MNPTELAIQKTRAVTGCLVVLFGNLAIGVAAVLGVAMAEDGEAAAILGGAFTAIGTLSAAYFGIRAATNTAQSALPPAVGADAPGLPDAEDSATA